MDASGEAVELLFLLALKVQTLGFETNLCSRPAWSGRSKHQCLKSLNLPMPII